MIDILNKSLTTVSGNFPPFAKAVGAITAAQFILGLSRRIQPDICSFTTLPSNRISDLRRVLSILVPTITLSLFSKQDSPVVFLKKNFILIALNIVYAVMNIEPFRSLVKNSIANVSTPKFINYASEKIGSIFKLTTGFRFNESNTLYRICNSALITPVVEEILFRGIIQEGICKQLPKFVLKSMNRSSEWVDHPATKIIRIGASALFFGMCHIKKHENDGLFNPLVITIGGIQEAYLQEYIGTTAAFLCHFNNNLYTQFAK